MIAELITIYKIRIDQNHKLDFGYKLDLKKSIPFENILKWFYPLEKMKQQKEDLIEKNRSFAGLKFRTEFFLETFFYETSFDRFKNQLQ